VPHLAVFDADPPVFGHPAAQRRRRPAEVCVLVADLAGDRHRGSRGPGALLAGGECLDPVQETQHLGQGLARGRRIVPVQVERGLQAGRSQLRHPRLRRHRGGPGQLPAALRGRDQAERLAQRVPH